MSEQKRSGTPHVIERTYRASLADVWELWTTKEGFESWWGPQGFRAEVTEIDARAGGTLRYAMIADAPEMIAEMQKSGQPTSHPVRSTFTEVEPQSRLVLCNVIDFLPGVAAYEANITVELSTEADSRVRMKVTLDAMHDETMSKMQLEGFTSQLEKLDTRFG